MNNKISLSIITPFYNGERFIVRLLKSIEQSYSIRLYRIEIEVLIIIDSPDTNVDDLKKMFECNITSDFLSKIQFYENFANIGVADSRNRGLEISKGDFVTFIDQDDTLDISYFNELEIFLNSYKYDFCLLNGYYIDLNSKKKVPLYFIKPSLTSKKFIQQNRVLTTGQIVFKKSFLEDNSLLFFDADKSFTGCDDWLLYLRVLETSFEYLYLRKRVYNYYFHDSNYSNDIKKAFLGSIYTLQFFIKECNERNKSYCKKAICRLNFEILLYGERLGLFKSIIKQPNGFYNFLCSRFFNMNRIVGYLYRKSIRMPFKV